MLPSNVLRKKLSSETTAMSATLAEEIDELNRKIALLDGDKKAYVESSQWSIKQNKGTIQEMRARNKALRSKLAKRMQADDEIIMVVFKGNKVTTPAELRGVNGAVAMARYDQSTCELMKRRNVIQHLKESRSRSIASFEAELKRMDVDESALSNFTAGDSDDAQRLRQLENRLDKVVIKNSESKFIRKTYQAIIQKLQDERLGFDNEQTELEKAIAKRKKDWKELESMCVDAQQARDLVKGELQHQELSMASSRRERDKVISEYRTKASERKEFQEKVERRLRRASMIHSISHMDSTTKTSQEVQEAKISSYEEALAKIKDATGVSNIQEVVDRFLNQGNTKKHLEQLKEENTEQLARLKEDKEKLQAQFEDMKYSGEAKMSTGQRMLEDFEGHLTDSKKGCDESKDRADRSCKLLSQVKSGVDHLHEKLQHIKAPSTHMLKPQNISSDEVVLEQLNTAEQKLVTLAEELGSRDLDTIHKEMEDEEFRQIVEGGVAGNIRVEMSKSGSKPALYDEDSGSDEECLSREAMKRMTAALVEAKTKKKPQDDDDEEDTKKRKRR